MKDSLLKNIQERKEELMVNLNIDFDSTSLILITNEFTIRVLISALGLNHSNIQDIIKRNQIFGMPVIVLESSKSGSNSESLQPYFEIHPIIK
jgi:hypothetical protein